MLHELGGTVYLLLPILGGALFHGLCVKYDWLARLARPIDGGRTLGGKPVFGKNKTFRGPVALGLGAALVMALQTYVLHRYAAVQALELFDYGAVNPWLVGFAMGAASMLTELPNSFLKRRLDVAPGAAAEGPRKWLFFFLDQVDLLLGVWLVMAFVMPVTLLHVGLSVLVVLLVHPLTTLIGYALRMRATPR